MTTAYLRARKQYLVSRTKKVTILMAIHFFIRAIPLSIHTQGDPVNQDQNHHAVGF